VRNPSRGDHAQAGVTTAAHGVALAYDRSLTDHIELQNVPVRDDLGGSADACTGVPELPGQGTQPADPSTSTRAMARFELAPITRTATCLFGVGLLRIGEGGSGSAEGADGCDPGVEDLAGGGDGELGHNLTVPPPSSASLDRDRRASGSNGKNWVRAVLTLPAQRYRVALRAGEFGS
jgi:hypothetical protein